MLYTPIDIQFPPAQTLPPRRKRVGWTWADSLGLRWGISTCQRDRSSGSVTWQAYRRNATSLYLLYKLFNFADQSDSRVALPPVAIIYKRSLTAGTTHYLQTDWKCVCHPITKSNAITKYTFPFLPSLKKVVSSKKLQGLFGNSNSGRPDNRVSNCIIIHSRQ